MELYTAEDLKQMGETWQLLDRLEEIGPARRRELVAMVRALAEMARENRIAREYLERHLAAVSRSLPSEVETFRAYCLNGCRPESARRIGRRLHIDTSTVHRHNRRVMKIFLFMCSGSTALLPGTKTEREGSVSHEARGGERFCEAYL